MRLATPLRQNADRHGLGKVVAAPVAVYLDDINVYEPDILFVSRKRRKIITEKGVEGAPDLVIEVLSPRTTRHDRVLKKRGYARAGVKEYWIVDTKNLLIEIYRFEENPEEPVRICRPGDTLSTPLFPGLLLNVSDILSKNFR